MISALWLLAIIPASALIGMFLTALAVASRKGDDPNDG